MIETISPNHVLLLDKEHVKTKSKEKSIFIPVYGKINCGNPNLIDSDLEGYLEIPMSLIGQGEFFVLRAKGDSMINIGVCSGDLLIIQHQTYAEDGQIVVAQVDEDVTLKRYYKLEKEKKYLLRPENDQFDDLIVSECKILGVAKKIIKSL